MLEKLLGWGRRGPGAGRCRGRLAGSRVLVVTASSAEIAEAEVAPPGWEAATGWLVRVGAWGPPAYAVVRRVTEVLPV